MVWRTANAALVEVHLGLELVSCRITLLGCRLLKGAALPVSFCLYYLNCSRFQTGENILRILS